MYAGEDEEGALLKVVRLASWVAPLALVALASSGTARADEHATLDEVMAAVPQLEELAQSLVDDDAVPGMAIGIVFRDQVVYLKGFGVREVGKDDEVTPDTVFQLASCSKPISATVVAKLVSDGALTWDSQISNIDPGFKLHDPYPTDQVTVRDLFAHRSGLYGHAGDDLEIFGFDRDTILSRLQYLKPTSSFRAGYAYSNYGLTAGAVAAARAAGLSWEDAAEQKLYRPLGMTSTSSRYSDFLKRTDRAALHVLIDGNWTPLVQRNPDPQAPAGGVSSSVRDLAQWVRLEINNGKYEGQQLIKPEALAETHIPVIQKGPDYISHQPSFYALGWEVKYTLHGVAWAHAGAFSAGARTEIEILPGQDLGIVVLTNAFPTGIPEGLSDTFFDLVLDGKPQRDWITAWNDVYTAVFGPDVYEEMAAPFATPPTPATEALPLASYLGTYNNNYIGDVTVALNDAGAPVMKIGPDGKTVYRLRHFDRDTFVYDGVAEAPSVPLPVTFTIGADGKADTLTLGAFNDNGQGVLARVGK